MHSTLTTDNDHASLLYSRRCFCLRTGAIATVSMALGWLPACTPISATASGDTPPDGDSGTAGPMWTKDIGLLVTVNRRGKAEIQKGSNIREEIEQGSDTEEGEEDYYLPLDEMELEEFNKVALVIVTKREIIGVVGEKVEQQWRWWRYTTARDAGTEEPIAAWDAAITIVVTADIELRFLKDAAIEGQIVEEYGEISRLERELDAQHLVEVSFSVYVGNPAAEAWWHDKTGGTITWGKYTIVA